MAAYFTDSSAAVKRYLAEVGSQWVQDLFAVKPPNEFYAVATIAVEVVAAITRRGQGGGITQPESSRLCDVFLFDLELDFETVSITDSLLIQAIYLARIYGLRGYDAVQLAAGLEVNRLRVASGLSPIIFVSADKELNASAQSEGLAVDDPNDHS